MLFCLCGLTSIANYSNHGETWFWTLVHGNIVWFLLLTVMLEWCVPVGSKVYGPDSSKQMSDSVRLAVRSIERFE